MRILSILFSLFMGLGLSQPVLAYKEADLQWLLFSKMHFEYLQKYNDLELIKIGFVRRRILDNNFRTFRFKSSIIEVSGADSSEMKEGIRHWSPTVKFRFVSSMPANGIYITTGKVSPNSCASAHPVVDDTTGEIVRCRITVGKSPRCLVTTNLAITLIHEVGHCLGFVGHTTDGGVMGAITTTTSL